MSDNNELHQFDVWLAGLVDEAGDTPTAVARLKLLTGFKKSLALAITELEALIAAENAPGDIETPYGAITVRKGPERYEYAKAGSDDESRFIDHVIARLLDKIDSEDDDAARPEEQVARMWAKIFPSGPRSARTGALKDLTGLSIYDYRTAKGSKSSVQLR